MVIFPRTGIALALLVVAGAAEVSCKSRSTSAADASTSATLPDLSASLGAVRREFNAHAKQARFLTLLSPT